jgi:hypothetical protein
MFLLPTILTEKRQTFPQKYEMKQVRIHTTFDVRSNKDTSPHYSHKGTFGKIIVWRATKREAVKIF